MLFIGIALTLASLALLPLVGVGSSALPIAFARKTSKVPIHPMCHLALKWSKVANSNLVGLQNKVFIVLDKFAKRSLVAPSLYREKIDICQACDDGRVLSNTADITEEFPRGSAVKSPPCANININVLCEFVHCMLQKAL